MLPIKEEALKKHKTKSRITDTFPWQDGVFKICLGENDVLVLNYYRNYLKLISVYIQQIISLQSHFKFDHRVSKLLSVEVFSNILKL